MIKPRWFKEGEVLVLNARTCGINKDGVEQYDVDPQSGARLETIDNELLALTNFVSDGDFDHPNMSFVSHRRLSESSIVVPSYFDPTYERDFDSFIDAHSDRFEKRSLAQLVASGELTIRKGHGSPSADQRVGGIPYIKVSDLRAGQVNVNPTNRVPRALAEKFWRGPTSGLQAYDLISPERASKNIGEFCVLLPGQEEMVLTKEMIVLRGNSPQLSQFFLLWALSLSVVRKQWERLVFMQTNREDVGDRYLELLIPYPKTADIAEECGRPFQAYFEEMKQIKSALRESLNANKYDHHVFFA